jgi:ABC-type nitrate/sulfonate/bicarbonate transport system permease component
MNHPEVKNSKIILSWFSLAFIYFILFEFVFPGSKIFIRPNLIGESIISLGKDYHLLNNFFYSFSGVYLSILVSYFLIRLLFRYVIELIDNFPYFFNFIGTLKYFPLIGIIAIFIYYFPESVVAEFVFSISFSFVFLVVLLGDEKNKVKREYLDSAVSFVGKNHKVIPEIIFKSSQPAILHSLERLNIVLWAAILLYEFIKGYDGIGYIYKMAIFYKDFSGLITLSIMLFIVVSLFSYLIRFYRNKFFQWDVNDRK